jgi:hypothetical protein
MADAKELFKDLEVSEEIQTTLLSRVETIETDFQGKLDDAINTRQAAKTKASEFENKYNEIQTKFASGEFDGKGALEEQITNLKTANDTLSSEKTALESNFNNLKTENESILTSSKEMLKSSFSEEKWEVVKDSPFDTLVNLAKLETPKGASVATGDKANLKKADSQLSAEAKMETLYK